MARSVFPPLVAVLLYLLMPVVTAQQTVGEETFGRDVVGSGDRPADAVMESDPQSSPAQRVEEAIAVLNEMRSDRRVGDLLERSRGVFIVPDYGEASFVIGAGGGDGVLLLRENGEWGNPAFYQVGSLSAGLQAGVVAGAFALVLVSDRAAAKFNREHNFSLSLEAGMVVVDRSAWARGDVGQDLDVLLWSDTEGLLAELSVGVNSIIWQSDANEAYYGYPVSPMDVLSGDAVNPYRSDLQQALLERD